MKGVAPESFIDRAPLKVKNVQLTRKSTRREVNRFLLSQPTTMKKIQGSHKRNRNREMLAEKLVIGGKTLSSDLILLASKPICCTHSNNNMLDLLLTETSRASCFFPPYIKDWALVSQKLFTVKLQQFTHVSFLKGLVYLNDQNSHIFTLITAGNYTCR